MTGRNLLRAQLLIEAADILKENNSDDEINEGAIGNIFAAIGFVTVGLPLLLCIIAGIVSPIADKLDTNKVIKKMKV